MRRLLVPLAVVALLASSWGALAQPGQSERGRETDRAKPAAMGGFQVGAIAREVNGEFVSFGFTDTTIDDFAVSGQPIFDVKVSGATGGGGAGAVTKDSEVRVRTPSFVAKVHDNPEAVTRIDTDGFVTLTLAGAGSIRMLKNHAEFAVGNVSGVIRGENLHLEGPVVTATDRLIIVVNAPRGSFDVHRERLSNAIGVGHVGIEASFNHGPDQVEQEIVSFGNVTMRTIKAERGNLTLEVDGHGLDGRVLVLNVDGRVLGAMRADDLSVLYDNESIQHASTLEDVLDPDDDGIKAEYYVVFDPAIQAFQLIVSVPHYSVHTLSVMTFPLADVPPSVVIGIVVGALILVPSALVLFRRK